MDIFEIATKGKYRFPYKGMISAEDLWDLNEKQLDGIYKVLNAEKKTTEEDSLLTERTKENDAVLNKIAIVKHIFEQKQAEIAENKKKRENAEKRQRILEIIDNKQNEALAGKSIEELRAMLNELS